jgi:hypothetical protein
MTDGPWPARRRHLRAAAQPVDAQDARVREAGRERRQPGHELNVLVRG